MKLPVGFFKFDAKDTLRLIIWVVIAAFSLGGLYAQRQADITRIDAERVILLARVEKAEKVAEVARDTQSAVLQEMASVRVELRYMNEKIDGLRADLRDRR